MFLTYIPFPTNHNIHGMAFTHYAVLIDNLDTDVLFFQTFGTKWIVLNSLKASSELLDQRGSNYADRPRFVMFEEYVKKKIQKIPVNHDVSSAL